MQGSTVKTGRGDPGEEQVQELASEAITAPMSQHITLAVHYCTIHDENYHRTRADFSLRSIIWYL
jgi:hypothetical protein